LWLLRWTIALDGASATDALTFVARNTTSQPIDVQIDVLLGDGVQTSNNPPYSTQIEARDTISLEPKASQLQLSEWPRATHVSARYQGSDGLSHRSGLETVWVRGTADLQHATVRSAQYESRTNMNTLAGLRAGNDSFVTGVPSAVHKGSSAASALATGTALGRTLPVSQSSSPALTHVTAKVEQAANKRNSILASPYTFCFTMPYAECKRCPRRTRASALRELACRCQLPRRRVLDRSWLLHDGRRE
jgi:hypothetical protein